MRISGMHDRTFVDAWGPGYLETNLDRVSRLRRVVDEARAGLSGWVGRPYFPAYMHPEDMMDINGWLEPLNSGALNWASPVR